EAIEREALGAVVEGGDDLIGIVPMIHVTQRDVRTVEEVGVEFEERADFDDEAFAVAGWQGSIVAGGIADDLEVEQEAGGGGLPGALADGAVEHVGFERAEPS